MLFCQDEGKKGMTTLDGKLRFVMMPVHDLKVALKWYRDQLGLEEAWREGDETVAFKLPGTDVQLMVDQEPIGKSGVSPMIQVASIQDFYTSNPANLKFEGEPQQIPGGLCVIVKDPAGNVIYFFDQSQAEE
jgi:catechol 2,3-dioxygenase-like lactoylglutathione lyase family enzyme